MKAMQNYAATPSRTPVMAAAPGLGAQLPPPGASPAGDLQRRVSEEALRSFYGSANKSGWREMRRWAAVVACCGLCWGAVFGAGGLIFG